MYVINVDLLFEYFLNKHTISQHVQCHFMDRKFKCNICTKSFCRKVILDNHLKFVHANPELFQCERCDKTFKHKHYLKLHLVSHEEKRDFSCSKNGCKSSFKTMKHLKEHVKRIHNSTNQFICEHCSKVFKRKHHFNQHLKTHMNRRQLKCNYCDKIFNIKSSFNRHTKTHANWQNGILSIYSKTFQVPWSSIKILR